MANLQILSMGDFARCLKAARARGGPELPKPGSYIIASELPVAVEPDPQDDRRLTFIVATADVNRNRWQLNPAGWKLENYQRNPVFLWAHDDGTGFRDSGSHGLPFGKAEKVWVEGNLLKIAVVWVNEGDITGEAGELCESVLRLYRGRYLNAVSAGWIPLKYEFVETQDDFTIMCAQQELVEVSGVPVPAEPNALRQAAAAGIDVMPIRKWAAAVLAEPRYILRLPEDTRPEAALELRKAAETWHPGAKILLLPERAGLQVVDLLGSTLREVLAATDPATAAADEPKSEIQSVIFPKKHWDSVEACKKWLTDNDFKAPEPDDTENTWRFRQTDPAKYESFRTICLTPKDTKPGPDCKVEASLGIIKKAGTMRIVTAGVVPSNVSTDKADEGEAWSAPTLKDFTDKAWGDLSDSEKRRIAGHFAWAAQMPPETFGDLKLPHHRASDGKVVWRGCAAAMAVCMGGRGGADIPEADLGKCRAHLAAHYKQFDKEVPEGAALHGLVIATGRVLSAANEESLKKAVSLVQGVIDQVEKDGEAPAAAAVIPPAPQGAQSAPGLDRYKRRLEILDL
jgi:hypothetical protein